MSKYGMGFTKLPLNHYTTFTFSKSFPQVQIEVKYILPAPLWKLYFPKGDQE